MCNFGLFLPKFGCHGNSLNFLENSGSIFEFTKPIKPTEHAKNSSIFARNRNLCNFGLYFFLNLVAMATSLAPLKTVIAYLNSPTQYPEFSCEKFLDFLDRTEISAFWLIFVQIWLPWQLLGLP